MGLVVCKMGPVHTCLSEPYARSLQSALNSYIFLLNLSSLICVVEGSIFPLAICVAIAVTVIVSSQCFCESLGYMFSFISV